ncbi:hypothetical protein BDV97DRAFT_136108 [Delphinella strobiligena]|nr:hypothetical protein BDV97DRAFT_136108 [Delphinella strobiligena]
MQKSKYAPSAPAKFSCSDDSVNCRTASHFPGAKEENSRTHVCWALVVTCVTVKTRFHIFPPLWRRSHFPATSVDIDDQPFPTSTLLFLPVAFVLRPFLIRITSPYHDLVRRHQLQIRLSIHLGNENFSLTRDQSNSDLSISNHVRICRHCRTKHSSSDVAEPSIPPDRSGPNLPVSNSVL